MRKSLLSFLILAGICANAQIPKIKFEYDNAGNQIVRQYVLEITGKKVATAAEPEKQDFKKFFEGDLISFYPNPVQEELYLKWEIVGGNKILDITVFDLNGRLLQKINLKEQDIQKTVSLHDYAVGTYLVNLNYSNGDNKTIKIIKK